MYYSKIKYIIKELKKYIKNNSLTIEQYKFIKKHSKNYINPQDFLYEILGKLIANIDVSEIINNIDNNRYGFKESIYNKFKEKRDLRDKFIANPPEIKENPNYFCPKCKGNRVIIVEIQIRSADEGFSYYLHCFNQECKYIGQTDNF